MDKQRTDEEIDKEEKELTDLLESIEKEEFSITDPFPIIEEWYKIYGDTRITVTEINRVWDEIKNKHKVLKVERAYAGYNANGHYLNFQYYIPNDRFHKAIKSIYTRIEEKNKSYAFINGYENKPFYDFDFQLLLIEECVKELRNGHVHNKLNNEDGGRFTNNEKILGSLEILSMFCIRTIMSNEELE